MTSWDTRSVAKEMLGDGRHGIGKSGIAWHWHSMDRISKALELISKEKKSIGMETRREDGKGISMEMIRDDKKGKGMVRRKSEKLSEA